MFMSSVKFVDKNKNSILIKYNFRSGDSWFVNHYFDIDGDFCRDTDFDKVEPANQEQTILMDFIIKNHNTKGSESLSLFDELIYNVSKVEQKRQDITLLNNKTDQELFFDIVDSYNDNFNFDNSSIARVIALIKHLENDFALPIECLSKITEVDNTFKLFNQSYLIVTDSEADELADSYYRDDIVNFIGLSANEWSRVEEYFDEDQFVQNCLQDGRGNALSNYDGKEYNETVNIEEEEEVFFIYRRN